MLIREHILSFKSQPLLKEFARPEEQTEIHEKFSLFVKIAEKHEGALIYLRSLYKIITVTIKAPKCYQAKLQQTTLYLFYFYLLKKMNKMFHVNPLPSRGFTRNIMSIFFCKIMKKNQNAFCCSFDWHFMD